MADVPKPLKFPTDTPPSEGMTLTSLCSSLSVTVSLPAMSVGTDLVTRQGTERTFASSGSITPLPSISMFVVEEPLPPRAPELPKVTMASARTEAPTGKTRTLLLKIAV